MNQVAYNDRGRKRGCVRKHRQMGPPMIWYDGYLIPWEVDDYGA